MYALDATRKPAAREQLTFHVAMIECGSPHSDGVTEFQKCLTLSLPRISAMTNLKNSLT